VFEAAVNKYAGAVLPALAPAPTPAATAPPDYAYLAGAVADLVKRVAALEQSISLNPWMGR